MKKSRLFSFALLTSTFTLLFAATLSAQETGTISGRVLDESNGEPVIGAAVAVVGRKIGAYTDTQGNYTVKKVPPGTHELEVTSLGYAVRKVEGVTVAAGGAARQDITLASSTMQTGDVEVKAKAHRQSENAALVERRGAAQVSDAISSEQMAKSSAGNAGDAMKRVTGVSVVGGKYVIVRGLSERYSTTQLNGVSLPSPEPEKKVVPFDLFPSNMVSRLTTIKTFTPDNPGDFAGGLVKITTKEFPESFLLSLNLGVGMNSETQGADALAYQGGSTDWLGIDDGTRALPADVPFGRRENAGQQAELFSRFSDGMQLPHRTALPVNRSFNFSTGNLFDVGIPIGFLISGSYANSYSFRQEGQAYPLLERGSDGHRSLRYDYDVQRGERATLWGGLFNLSAQLAPEHKVSFKAIYNHSSEDESRLVTGLYNQSSAQELRFSRLRFLERAIGSLQLDGEHQIAGFLNSKIDWRAAVSLADRSEPDNRSTVYSKRDDGSYTFINNFGSNNGRFFSDLVDNEKNLGLDWAVPFASWTGGQARVKVGGLGRFRDREFDARRFVFTATGKNPELLTGSPEELFTEQNIRDGVITFDDETQRTDNYRASERTTAGYAMIDLPITGTLRFVGGVRYEMWNLDVSSADPITGAVNSELAVDRAQNDLLPSANFIYALAGDMNLRLSATQTLARPEFRELAPFRFDDYRQSTYGNPALERTKIVNIDTRWEWFPRGGEVIAVSGFYKSFSNPIEQFYLVGGSGISVEPANANDAVSFGGELEIRKALDFIAPSLESFSIGGNLTVVTSEVTFTPGEIVRVFDGVGMADYSPEILTSSTRPLQGQSPYVINASLGYDNDSWGTGAALHYNIFGRRLAVVGTNGIPDAYEQPRHSLDLTVTQRLPAGLQLKLSAVNMLDGHTTIQQEFGDGEIVRTEEYLSGRSISLGIGFNLDQLQIQNLESQ